MLLVDDQTNAALLDCIGTIAADHDDVVDAFLLERFDQMKQERLARDRQHHLRTIGSHGFQSRATARGKHHRAALLVRGGQIDVLGGRILVGVLQTENLVHRCDAVFHVDERLAVVDFLGDRRIAETEPRII